MKAESALVVRARSRCHGPWHRCLAHTCNSSKQQLSCVLLLYDDVCSGAGARPMSGAGANKNPDRDYRTSDACPRASLSLSVQYSLVRYQRRHTEPCECHRALIVAAMARALPCTAWLLLQICTANVAMGALQTTRVFESRQDSGLPRGPLLLTSAVQAAVGTRAKHAAAVTANFHRATGL